MPGLPEGLEEYKEFSPHINIIAGPNASGKSSTARMIQQIISRNNTDRMQANSIIELDKEHWQINIESKHVQVQREGIDDQITGLPSVETQERYMLAFHELVNHQEQNLAHQIMRESIGGYDLEEAKNHLRYYDTPSKKNIKQYVKYDEAVKEFEKIQKRQKDLKEEEESLQELYQKKEKAKEAAKKKELFAMVKEWLEQKQAYEQLKDQYQAFPEVMKVLNGEEMNKIEELEDEINNAQRETEEAQQKTEECQRTLSGLTIPQEGVENKTLDELERKTEQLEETERKIREKEEQIAGTIKEEEEELKNIGTSLDPEAWEGIDLKDVSNLQEFMDKATKAYSEKQFLETEIDKLQQETESVSNEDPDKLKEGIKALANWLKQHTQSGIPGKWLWSLAGAGVLTAVLTMFFGAVGLLGLILIAAFIFLGLQSKSAGQGETRKKDYLDTGLQEPSDWNVGQVSEMIDILSKKLGEISYIDKINQKIEQRSEERKLLETRLNKINEDQQKWVEKLKTAPDLPEKDVKNYSGLHYFLIHVINWQKKHAETESLKAEKNELSQRHTQLLEEINGIFKQNKAESAKDAAEAKAIFKKLKNEEEIRSKNTEEIDRNKGIIRKNQNQAEEKTQKLQNIYKKLNLQEGEKEKVHRLAEQLDSYKEVERNFQFSQKSLKEKEAGMEGHSLYQDHQHEIVFLSPDQVDEKIRENREKADQLDQVSEEITQLETRIEDAKKQSELEKALKEKEQRLADLKDLYESNLSSITGHLLVEQLKETTREQNQTPVFKRANELFGRITRGRYQLRLEENGEPVFKALDTVLNQGQHLEELSTGTRIQLLLSVRLAYIETQESVLKLPVLADELLANSDDIRAKAIIDALVEISKEGRQVFYFTAQADEVAKWKAHLDNQQDISYKVCELAGEKNETIAYNAEKESFGSFELKQSEVPKPKNMSHEAYGELLNIPGFDPLLNIVDQIHIWYLLEEPELIYNCLVMGIKYWGQLKSFLENNGQIEGFDEDIMQKLKEKTALLERFLELYKQGKSIPVSRETLEHSGAVSANFIETVNKKLNEVDKDPARLIRALRQGEVPRFTKAKINELETYFLEHGFLSEEEPLDKQDIILEIQAMISGMNVKQEEAERMIEDVLKE